VLESAITAITPRGPAYRGHLAIDLVERGFESVAELLWSGELRDAPPWPRIAVPVAALAKIVGESARPIDTMPLVVQLAALADPIRNARADGERRDGRIETARDGRIDAARDGRIETARDGRITARDGRDPRAGVDIVDDRDARDRGRDTTRLDTFASCGRRLIPLLAATLAPSFSAAAITRASSASSVARIAARALDLDDELAPELDRVFVLLADHELNASSFTARVAASTDADPYACVAAALATMSGPKHGSASEELAHFADRVGSPSAARAEVRARKRRGLAVPGFGHPLYANGDPRAAPLIDAARRVLAIIDASEMTTIPDASHSRTRTTRRPTSANTTSANMTSANATRRPTNANTTSANTTSATSATSATVTRARIILALVDASDELPSVDVGLAALVAALGLAPSVASGLFAVARCAGWLAHGLEQRDAGYLLRPRARYIGRPIDLPGS
jgi:citrate synthase